MNQNILKDIVAKSSVKNMPVSARRVKLVADLIRGKKVIDAENILKFDNRKASQRILPMLKSAVASAIELKKVQKEDVYVSGVLVGQGVFLKNRGIFGARGQFKPMKKRTTNLTIYLNSINNLQVNKEK